MPSATVRWMTTPGVAVMVVPSSSAASDSSETVSAGRDFRGADGFRERGDLEARAAGADQHRGAEGQRDTEAVSGAIHVFFARP